MVATPRLERTECEVWPKLSPTLGRVPPRGGGDAVLLARLSAGDDRALRIVYDQHADMVYGLAQRVTRDDHRAREITQEVFTYLWSQPQRVHLERGSLRAFLGVVTHHRAVDEVRRVTRRSHAESKAHQGDAVDDVASLFALVDVTLDNGPDAQSGLRPAALARAFEQRTAGLALDRPEPRSPLAAFTETTEDFRALLASLSAQDWRAVPRPSHEHVGALVAHVAGMEQLTRDWLAGPVPDPATVADHLTATAPMVAELADQPGPAVAALWYELAQEAAAAAAAAPVGHSLVAHDLPTDTDGLLVLGTFELWAHMDDVRAANCD